MLTRLQLFLLTNKIRPQDLTARSGYSRQHLLRLRDGESMSKQMREHVRATLSELTERPVEMSEVFDEPPHPSPALLPASSAEAVRFSRRRRLAILTMVRAIGSAIDALPEAEIRAWATAVSEDQAVRSEVSVRVLLSAARLELTRDPLRADLMYATAATIADNLGSTPPRLAASFRGHCLKGRANALRGMGRFSDALAELEAAEREFNAAEFCLSDIADVRYSRVLILFSREEWRAALAACAGARLAYKAIGNVRGMLRVDYLAACIAYEEGSIPDARDRWSKLLGRFESHSDRPNLARTLLALAMCECDLGNFETARPLLGRAKVLLTSLGMTADLVRVDALRAKLAISTGQRDQGLAMLREARRRFDDLHMPSEADVAGIELLSEIVRDPAARVEAIDLCHSIAERLLKRGESVSAAKVAADLRELADHGTADVPEIIRAAIPLIRKTSCGPVQPRKRTAEEPV